MAEFNTNGFQKNRASYLILLIVLLIILVWVARIKKRELFRAEGVKTRRGADGNGEAYYYGRGSEEDSVEDLLNRIDWSTYLEKRVSYWTKIFAPILIIVIFICVFVLKKIPHPSTVILLFVLIFIPIYASHNFDYVHGHIYNDYYIKRNVELLRKKLNLRKGNPPQPTDTIPSRIVVTNAI